MTKKYPTKDNRGRDVYKIPSKYDGWKAPHVFYIDKKKRTLEAIVGWIHEEWSCTDEEIASITNGWKAKKLFSKKRVE